MAISPIANKFIEDPTSDSDLMASLGSSIMLAFGRFEDLVKPLPAYVDSFKYDYWLSYPGKPSKLAVLIPVDPSKVSFEQIVDFRAKNDLRRVKFQAAADTLIKSFGEASTEDEAVRLLSLVEQELRDQYQKLETIYRHTRIEAAARTVGTIGGPPAVLRVMESVLGISCIEAAGFVASVALSIVPWLMAREKADVALNDSPWAYMWHMKHNL